MSFIEMEQTISCQQMEIEDLKSRVNYYLANPTKLRTELEVTRSVIIQHAIGMLNQIGLSGAEADEIVKRGVK